MKFSEKWLREWVNPDLDSTALVEKLTQAGLEVDAIEPVAGEFKGVVVGQVLSVDAHPDADKLRLCQVDVAADEPLSIVCGAANVRQGLKIPVAVIGSVLPGNFKIKKAKLRGVESFGMLCSEKELGLAESADGLMELVEDAPVGSNIRDYLNLDDVSIDVDLTPNRSDCLGVAGIAREVGVLTGCDVTSLTQDAITEQSQKTVAVQVEDTQACPRYLGRVIENIDVNALTPVWMQEKLRRSGLRSISPVVDVTNYVMLELGQPMHAFDLCKLNGDITVRAAKQGELLTLLDSQEITVNDNTLLITDQSGPLALAGIMGGQDSSVDNQTKDLFLEAAFFSPTSIAGRARSYGLHTDSSHRFERGVDPELAKVAMDRATSLLLSIVGGDAGAITEVTTEADMPQKQTINLRAARIKRVLGIAIEAEQVEEQLTRLGLTVESAEDGWNVTVPSFRFDLSIEVDLIEELGRLYGYDLLPNTRPQGTVLTTNISEHTLATERLQNLLVDRGYQEAITYSFVDPTIHQHFLLEGMTPITLANPISADLSEMRTSLWPGLIQALVYNLNRQHERVRLFEVGRIYIGTTDNIKQHRQIGGVVCGSRYDEQWSEKQRPVDFFDAKADVEELLSFSGGDISFVAEQHSSLHPGQSARIYKDGQAIGWLGALHPRLNKPLGFDGKVYVFELALTATLAAQVPSFEPLSRFPANRRDLALLVDKNITAGEIERCLNSIESDILKSIQLFDVYTGDGVELGKKSIAIAFHIQHGERTLTDEEVEALMLTITQTLEQELKAVIRS
ncbi:phenylalanine--tRNA ligase subunit beta [Methylophaga sp. 42_25_T18]|nr:phenylalanine--tRNA ligase subunit beta [Methylophaga sp. 42_25_T18]OUR88093.1 phenylalanine--tRNA ligase subunit beta [Methylophaga sp. 42_8_T64]